MSKLVALWDKSYQFDDDELAAFAAIHNDLAKPFLPDPDYEEQPVENPGTFSDWYMKLARDPLDSSHQPDIIAPELLTEYKELTSSYQSAVHLKENLDALMELTRTLSESLDLVKAKSNGMKSLWEGLLTQHVCNINGLAFMVFCRSTLMRLQIGSRSAWQSSPISTASKPPSSNSWKPTS